MCLGLGYYIAIVSKLNSGIFLDFFLAVALVSIGTHFFFTSSIIILLKILKGNKKLYYNRLNYTTISGMLYRMRKSAASLANICIFSTMTIITLLCTISLWYSTESILDYQYPFDAVIDFKAQNFSDYKTLEDKINELEDKSGVNIKEKLSFNTREFLYIKKMISSLCLMANMVQ